MGLTRSPHSLNALSTSLWQSGSGKDGGELKASEFAESRVRSLAITKCYTTETGERAKAYERAQRGRVGALESADLHGVHA